ncbi:MAG: DegT/DnrJ/EryC1/StrS family aminotransferase [Candidatus Hodarchaeales archaeon]
MEKLAIYGGEPVRETKLPLFEVDIRDEEAKNVLEVLKSRDLVQTHGRFANEFGQLIKDYLDSNYVILANNGTSTIHLALIAIGIQPGDEVICSPMGWISSGTPVLYQNAIPIYADVDPVFGFIDIEDVRKKITPSTRAISIVHTWGLPIDLDPFLELAEEKDLYIIEDAAEGLGATYKTKKIGTLGTFGSFSTVWNKIITTGEGGFLVTDDENLAEKAYHYSNFAKVQGKGDYFDGLGYNYRMTELMGALGVAQIKRVDELIEKRRNNANYLIKELNELDIEGLQVPHDPEWGKGVWWKFTILLDLEKFTASRDKILEAIRAEGILSSAPIVPDNLQPLYQRKQVYGNTQCPWVCNYYYRGQEIDYSKMCPNAEVYAKRAIWLIGCSPRLSHEDLESIVRAVEKVLTYFQKK